LVGKTNCYLNKGVPSNEHVMRCKPLPDISI